MAGMIVFMFSGRRKMTGMTVFALSGRREMAGMPVFVLSGCREMAETVVSGVFQRAAGVATAVVSPRGFPRGPRWQAEDARRR